jgi:hypothetical protein
MNPSPYFTGSAPNFGPPSGMAGLISQDREMGSHADISGFQKFADVAEQYKNKQDMAKSMDYFFKANPNALSEMGIHPEEYKTLGADERIAAGKGFVMAQAQKNVMQQMAEVGQRLQSHRDERAASQAFGQTVQAATAPLMPGGSDAFVQSDPTGVLQAATADRPLTMETFARAARANPIAWTAPEARPFVAAAATASPEESTTPTFTEDPVSGFRFVTKGKIVQPSGVNPKMAQAAAAPVPQHDEAGNLIGWSQTDLRGHSSFKTFKGGAKLAPAVDDQDNPIPGFYMTPEGKVVDSRTAIQKMTGTAPTPAAAPKSKGALAPKQAQEFLDQAGGDKDKARELARNAGYTL